MDRQVANREECPNPWDEELNETCYALLHAIWQKATSIRDAWSPFLKIHAQSLPQEVRFQDLEVRQHVFSQSFRLCGARAEGNLSIVSPEPHACLTFKLSRQRSGLAFTGY